MFINRAGYSLGEEIANSIVHGLGWALSLAALALMLVFSSIYGDAWHIVSCSVYGVGLILVYTSSTMYHSLTNPTAKRVFKVLDHTSIFVLIAGTYTPFALVTLRGGWGWTVFGIIWLCAVLGIIFKVFFTGRYNVISTMIYIGMGWVALIAIKPMLENIPTGGLLLLVAGGLAYTLGAMIYIRKTVRYNHAIWHGFVLAGSILHFFSVFLYVVPRGG